MSESYRLRYTNQIVGIFLLIFLLFLFVVSVLVLRVNYFVRPVPYLVDVAEEDIADLHRGAEVLLLGEYVGQVDDIRYKPGSSRVRVTLAIEPQKSRLIGEDSVVQLERKYGVGAPVLIIRRVPTAGPLEVSDSGIPILPFREQPDRIDQLAREVESVSESVRLIQQAMEPTLGSIEDAAVSFESTLNESVDPAFESAEAASESFRQSNEVIRPDILETTATIRQATTNLEQRIAALTDSIDRLVEDDARPTFAEIRESSEDVGEAARSVAQSSERIDQNVAETLQEMRLTIDEVGALASESREVVRIIRDEADELPGTTARVADTVYEAGELVDQIQNHWLLRRYRDRDRSTDQISPSAIRGGR